MVHPDASSLAQAAIAAVRARAVDGPPVEPTARIALHFHPDSDLFGLPTLKKMIDDGEYVSQFVTGTSNGGLTASQGGDRWQWEQRLFDGLYDNAEARSRPVYGALMIDPDPYGPSPRFGSAFLRLRQEAVQRSTFTYPDSGHPPLSFGIPEHMGLERELRARNLTDDPLNQYIEAQIHGGVGLPADVEALVLDPSFAGSEIAISAVTAGLAVEWHPGYVIDVDSISQHSEYRGDETVALARRLAGGELLTPAALGRARGRKDVHPQLLKFVWHYLARYGRADGHSPRPDRSALE